jgi:hypothetical protein
MIDPMIIVIQFINIVLVVVWFAAMFMAFSRMRTMSSADGMNFAWVLLIIFIPILGAMVFLMRHPRKRKNS